MEKILNLIKVVWIGKNSYDFKHAFKLMYFKQITEQFLNIFLKRVFLIILQISSIEFENG